MNIAPYAKSSSLDFYSVFFQLFRYTVSGPWCWLARALNSQFPDFGQGEAEAEPTITPPSAEGRRTITGRYNLTQRWTRHFVNNLMKERPLTCIGSGTAAYTGMG